jgi:hypothetical protein
VIDKMTYSIRTLAAVPVAAPDPQQDHHRSAHRDIITDPRPDFWSQMDSDTAVTVGTFSRSWARRSPRGLGFVFVARPALPDHSPE